MAAGYRVITYDRRGFGNPASRPSATTTTPSPPTSTPCSSTSTLDDVDLVGFSMGAGEVARYLGSYGSARVRKAALLGAIPPFLLQTDDNPDGVPGGLRGHQGRDPRRPVRLLQGLPRQLLQRRRARRHKGQRQALQASFNVAAGASPYASYACVDTWLTDFRADLPKIDVPTLVVHGTADRILPFEATAARLPDLSTDVRW